MIKISLLWYIMIAAVYCANSKNICRISEKRATACTKIYDPVCAVQKNLGGKYTRVTKSNRCTACSEVKTEYILNQTCESIPPTSTLCNPKQSSGNWMCNEIYDPVCGYFESNIQCLFPPCAADYSNTCEACLDSKVIFTTKGNCRRSS